MNSHIELRSDNAAGAAPEIMAAIAAANTGSALAYGADEWTSQLRDKVREVQDLPDVRLVLISELKRRYAGAALVWH